MYVYENIKYYENVGEKSSFQCKIYAQTNVVV